MLEIKDIYKSFGEKKVLEGVSLKLEDSGIYAVTGKSGCGKTTLFGIILGLIPHDKGEIVNGFEKTRAMFQEDRLLEHKTPVENLTFIGADKERAKALLKSLGLERELTLPSESSRAVRKDGRRLQERSFPSRIFFFWTSRLTHSTTQRRHSS